MTDATTEAASPDPAGLLRSRRYLVLVVFGAVVGVPVAVVAYFFLKAVGETQHYVFATLPGEVGYGTEPVWWLRADHESLPEARLDRLAPRRRGDPLGRVTSSKFPPWMVMMYRCTSPILPCFR